MRRVAVTGIGLLTSLGEGVESSWSRLLDGADGHRPVTLFDTAGQITDTAAEIPSIPEPRLDSTSARRLLRVDRIGLAAAEEAVDRSGLADAGLDADRVSVCFGAGAAGLLEAWDFFRRRDEGGRPGLRHYFGEIQSGTSRWIAHRFGFEGPRTCPSTACSSSLTAIGIGASWIAAGEVDACVAGGAEGLGQLTFSGFDAVSALGPVPCSPFSAGRRGMSLGEGGAALVLESMENARARGATILAEVLSFGTSLDAHHMTAPHPEGAGVVPLIERCIEEAGLTAGDIGYVSAHGTGTIANDVAECTALSRVFGDHAARLAVASQKSALGHCLGAAGAIESAVTVQALADGVVPPNLRLAEVDPDCGSFRFPTEATPMPDLRYALKQSFGFGGSNAALVLGTGEDA
ncbi:MAG: beta-ketoacyl-[acyl-carrier-protein] synthase family protein [Planctomycetota bacterium]